MAPARPTRRYRPPVEPTWHNRGAPPRLGSTGPSTPPPRTRSMQQLQRRGGSPARVLRSTLTQLPVADPRHHRAAMDVATPDPTAHPTRWWHRLDDGRLQCDVCPRACKLHDGQRGLCFVRMRRDDQIVLTTYGRSSGFCIDPIEKKPLKPLPSWQRGAGVRDGRLQPGLPLLPKLGHLEIPRDRHPVRRGRPRGTGPCRSVAGVPQRRLHLQRPSHLHGVRHRCGPGLPRAGHQVGGDHRRLHATAATGRVLPAHGTRPTSISRGSPRTSTIASAPGGWRRCWRRSSTSSTRPRYGSTRSDCCGNDGQPGC